MIYWGYLYNWLGEDGLENGRVALNHIVAGTPDPKSPAAKFSHEYDEKYVDAIDVVVKEAKEGELFRKVEAVLVTAHFLKHNWPIPDSLSDYMSEALIGAAVAFGHTEGRSEKRDNAVCERLGLLRPQGAKSKKRRDKLIHNYIKWRMELYSETKQDAVRCALKAFEGTNYFTHDNVEAIFDRCEKNSVTLDCPSYFWVINDCGPKGLVFKDDEFLRTITPKIDDRHPNKKEWMERFFPEH